MNTLDIYTQNYIYKIAYQSMFNDVMKEMKEFHDGWYVHLIKDLYAHHKLKIPDRKVIKNVSKIITDPDICGAYYRAGKFMLNENMINLRLNMDIMREIGLIKLLPSEFKNEEKFNIKYEIYQNRYGRLYGLDELNRAINAF